MSSSHEHQSNVAWRIEAGTLPEMNFQDYRDQLIYETPKIKRFLSDGRSELFIISAPKGFGKTLLLIAKKKQLEERDSYRTEAGTIGTESRHVIGSTAGGEIVDRPTGVFPSLSKERIAVLKSDYQHWKNIWKIAIMATALKISLRGQKNEVTIDLKEVSPLLKDFISNSEFQSVATIFSALIEAGS